MPSGTEKVEGAARRPPIPSAMPTSVVRGQYRAGAVDGQEVPGYRDEPDVAPDSRTETFVALRLHIDNWRWAGRAVLPAGRQAAGEAGHGDRHPVQAGAAQAVREASPDGIEPNLLVMRIQPDEGISLRFGAKLPGPVVQVRPVTMDFRYATSFGTFLGLGLRAPAARLHAGGRDALARKDAVDAAWSVVTPILRAWEGISAGTISELRRRTSGPPEADRLLGAVSRFRAL